MRVLRKGFPVVAAIAAVVCLTASCGKNKIDRSREFVKKGLDAYKAKDYETASVSLKRALEMQPGNAHAHYYLGAVYRDYEKMTDNIPAAIKELEAAIAADVNMLDAYILLASIHLSENQFEKTEAVCKRAVKVKDDDPEPRYWLAESYFRREMYEETEAECKRALRLDPTHAQAGKLLTDVKKILDF